MGFFKFMNKDKKHKLDLPPAPPAQDMPSLEKEFPSLPDIPSGPPENKKATSNDNNMRMQAPDFGNAELPPLPQQENMQSKASVSEPPVSDYGNQEPMQEPEPPQRSEPQSGEPIYMEVEHYRGILEKVNSIKDSVKEADTALQRLNDLKNERDRELGRWHARMGDLQKKLSYVDSSLFEGS